MNITDGLHTLWDSTGIMGFVHSAQNAVADPNLQGFEQILSDYSKVHKTNKHALTAFRNMYFPLLMNKMISIHDIVDCWKNKEHFDFALVELVFDLMNTWKNIEKEEAMKAMKEAALTMDLLFVGGCPSMVAKRILSKFNMIEKESVIDFA